MKNWNLKKLMILAASISVVGSVPAVRAATTGQLTIQGTVPAATAIVVNGAGSYNALSFSSAATDLVVANIREINNTANGYTVTLSSANSGAFKNGTIGSVTYTAKYDGTSVNLSSTPVNVTVAAPSDTVVNTLKELAISYSAHANETLMQGAYTDTLTFTISAN